MPLVVGVILVAGAANSGPLVLSAPAVFVLLTGIFMLFGCPNGQARAAGSIRVVLFRRDRPKTDVDCRSSPTKNVATF